jgi:hypothetical protein
MCTAVNAIVFGQEYTQNGNGHFLAYTMMDKLSQPGDRKGDAPPFTLSTITYEVVVYAPAERADTLPLFLLYPYMYSMVFGNSAVCMCSMTPCAVTVHTVQWALAVIMY